MPSPSKSAGHPSHGPQLPRRIARSGAPTAPSPSRSCGYSAAVVLAFAALSPPARISGVPISIFGSVGGRAPLRARPPCAQQLS